MILVKLDKRCMLQEIWTFLTVHDIMQISKTSKELYNISIEINLVVPQKITLQRSKQKFLCSKESYNDLKQFTMCFKRITILEIPCTIIFRSKRINRFRKGTDYSILTDIFNIDFIRQHLVEITLSLNVSTDFKYLLNLTNLMHLGLEYSTIINSSMRTISKLANLRSITFGYYTNIVFESFKYLSILSHLRILIFDDQFGEEDEDFYPTHHALINISMLTQVTSLKICCNIRFFNVSSFIHITHLEMILIDQNYFWFYQVYHMENLLNLQTLKIKGLDYNNLSKIPFQSLLNLDSLDLVFTFNGMNYTSFNYLQNISNLKNLSINESLNTLCLSINQYLFEDQDLTVKLIDLLVKLKNFYLQDVYIGNEGKTGLRYAHDKWKLLNQQ